MSARRHRQGALLHLWRIEWLTVPMSPCPPSTRFPAVCRRLLAMGPCSIAQVMCHLESPSLEIFHSCHCHCFRLVRDIQHRDGSKHFTFLLQCRWPTTAKSLLSFMHRPRLHASCAPDGGTLFQHWTAVCPTMVAPRKFLELSP